MRASGGQDILVDARTTAYLADDEDHNGNRSRLLLSVRLTGRRHGSARAGRGGTANVGRPCRCADHPRYVADAANIADEPYGTHDDSPPRAERASPGAVSPTGTPARAFLVIERTRFS
jgi:hypothetical protein